MKIFLTVPFSSKVDTSGAVDANYRAMIEKLLLGLRDAEHTVFCALEHAGWTMGGTTSPEEEFKKDLAEIDTSDKLIILLEENVSAGVQIENGYAYAKGKTLEMYQQGKPAWSNIAFSRVCGNDLIPVQTIEDFVNQAVINNP